MYDVTLLNLPWKQHTFFNMAQDKIVNTEFVCYFLNVTEQRFHTSLPPGGYAKN